MRIICLAAILLALTACTTVKTVPPGEAKSFPNFRIQVLWDHSGDPVANAEVCVFGRYPSTWYGPNQWLLLPMREVSTTTVKKLHSVRTNANGMVSIDLSQPQNYGVRVDDHKEQGNFYRRVDEHRSNPSGLDQWVWLNEDYLDGSLLEWRLKARHHQHKDGYGLNVDDDLCDESSILFY